MRNQNHRMHRLISRGLNIVGRRQQTIRSTNRVIRPLLEVVAAVVAVLHNRRNPVVVVVVVAVEEVVAHRKKVNLNATNANAKPKTLECLRLGRLTAIP
jgi:hypothetical protein